MINAEFHSAPAVLPIVHPYVLLTTKMSDMGF